LSKDSHNSHLPPSSDRFVRQPKSLRTKSGKMPGGQEGHPGKMLMWREILDEVIVHPVTCCEHCQSDLQAVTLVQIERRQGVDVPAPR
jgi:transposase